MALAGALVGIDLRIREERERRREAARRGWERRRQRALRMERTIKTERVKYLKDIQVATMDTAYAETFWARKMHFVNMNILGMNMSMLGLWWTMKAIPGVTDEMADSFRACLAPIQMTLVATNFLLSIMGLYNSAASVAIERNRLMAKEMPRSVMQTERFGIVGRRLAKAFVGIGAAMVGTVALIQAFNAESREARAMLLAIAGAAWSLEIALLALSTAYMKKAIAALAARCAIFGPLAPIVAGVAIAGLIAAVGAGIGAMLGYFTPMQRGGIVTKPTLALLGERGKEAVIPLERGEVPIQINQYITTDSPSVLANLVGREIRRELAT